MAFFNPLGYSKDGSTVAFIRRRTSVIKHGRISMLAAVGYAALEITGDLSGRLSPTLRLELNDIPDGLGAIDRVPFARSLQIRSNCASVEVSSDGNEADKQKPGDYGC